MITQTVERTAELRQGRRTSNPSLLSLRAKLIASLRSVVDARKLSQVQAARLCQTDQPTLSKVLSGRTDSISVGKLVEWLFALGQSVEVRVEAADSGLNDPSTGAFLNTVPGLWGAPRQNRSRTNFRPIYLDHHSTTPLDPRVSEVIVDVMMCNFGNANSPDHAYGETASAIVEHARSHVAWLVGSDSQDVRFTSGATESLRLALSHAQATSASTPLRVALTTVEHPSLIDLVRGAARIGAVGVSWIDVDHRARLVEATLEAALRSGVDLICVMAANNEVGTVYPIASIAARAHQHGAAILVDATQAAGRADIRAQEWGIDYLTLSAHKLYGPKGVGALVMPGGNTGHNKTLLGAAGTPNVPGIAGFGKACELRRLEMRADEARIAALRDRMERTLCATIPQIVINGDRAQRLSHNLHFSVPGLPNDAIVARLRRHVALSTGAACASGTDEPSHVLRAMGLPVDVQEGALRIGLGKFNTRKEIDQAAAHIADAVRAVGSIINEEIS